MDTNDVLRYFDERLNVHGSTVRAVDWDNEGSQHIRFAVLAAVGSLEDARILDVGCGLGDLARFLDVRAPSARYEGCDVNPRMVAAARTRVPRGRFLVADPLGDSKALTPPYDWVLASGLFYLRDAAFFDAMVVRLFGLASRGVAFNTLSAWADRCEPGEFYADPAQALACCRRLTRRITLRHDYLPHDFTVYAYRDA